MIPRYSFSMLGRNLDLVFKVLIYVFVLMLICSALLVSIVNPILDALNSNIDISDRLLATLSDLINREHKNVFQQFIGDLNDVAESISSEIIIAVLLIIMVIFITKFFFALTSVPIGELIYGRMSQNFSVKFHNVLVASLGKAFLYSLIHALVTLVADALIVTIGYYLSKLLFAAIGAYGLSLAAFVFFGLMSARLALLGQWVPQIVGEKKSVTKAFRDSFRYSVKYFWKVLPVHFLIMVIGFAVVALTTVFTFGLLPVIVMPIALVLVANLNLVTYFTFNKRKFYVDEVTVINQIENDEE